MTVDAAPAPLLARDPLLGQLLEDRYQLDSILGAGGMGTVYLAHNTITQKTYAVKVMHSQLLTNEGALKRFDREARSLSAIDHPHIVEVYDHGRTPSEVPFLVMEYLLGTTLRQCLVDIPGAGLPLIQAVAIARQLAEALHHVHARGIVHRDVKPDNIQLTVHNDRSVFAKLFDFGIARIQSQGAVTEINAGPPSTLAYAAPEIHLTADYLTPAIDVYALGITLFEMITKERPFIGTGLDVVWAHLKSPPRQLSQLRQDIKIPTELEQLTAHMLAKQPAQRATMAQVVERLAGIAASLQVESARSLHSLRTYVLPEKRRDASGGRATGPLSAGQPQPATALQVLSHTRDIDLIETEREKVSAQLQRQCESLLSQWREGAPPELIERLRRCMEIATVKTELTRSLTQMEAELAQERTAARVKRNALRQKIQELRDILRAPAAANKVGQEKAQELARVERAYAAPEPVSDTAERVQREGTKQQQLRAELLDTQRSLADDLLVAIRASAKLPKGAGGVQITQKLSGSMRQLIDLQGQLEALNASLQQT